MLLTDAITAAEAAAAGYTQATTTVANDTAAIAPLQAKLDAANAQITTDTMALGAAATAFNSALQDLSAAALAAIVPAPVPPPAAPLPPPDSNLPVPLTGTSTAGNIGSKTGII